MVLHPTTCLLDASIGPNSMNEDNLQPQWKFCMNLPEQPELATATKSVIDIQGVVPLEVQM